MKKLFAFFSIFFSLNAFADKNNFTFDNQPINPACLAMFNASIADYPYIRAINLNECQKSNAAWQTTRNNNDYYYFYINDKDETQGRYEYKVMGKTTNGIYVVQTWSSGGGTLVASELLFLRLTQSQEFSNERVNELKLEKNEISELKLLGFLIGGDRCVGSFIDVKVVGNQVKIKQHHGSSANDCDKTREGVIDLSKLG